MPLLPSSLAPAQPFRILSEPANGSVLFSRDQHKRGSRVCDAGGKSYIVWHDGSLRRQDKVVTRALAHDPILRAATANVIEQHRLAQEVSK